MSTRITASLFGAALALTVTATIVIVVLPIASWRTPASQEDKLDEFTLSEACVAEMGAATQKTLDYQKSHEFPPLVETFWPPCLKQEGDAWAYNICLKKQGGDADYCRDAMKAANCLNQDQLDDQCIDTFKAFQKRFDAQSPASR
jgi:hypothetical protein